MNTEGGGIVLTIQGYPNGLALVLCNLDRAAAAAATVRFTTAGHPVTVDTTRET